MSVEIETNTKRIDVHATKKCNLQCPVCGVSQFRQRFEKKGHQFWQCESCSMELQHPLPTAEELKDYYDTSYTDGMYSDFAAAKPMKRMTAARRLLEMRNQVPISGEWLDVGCADGTFIEVAKEHGAKVQGVELSDVAAKLATEAGLDVHCGTIDSLPESATFDTITAFDVLEHVLDPVEFIQSLRKRVRNDGHVVLTLPDLNSLARKMMGSRWYFYIPEEHLHYFNRDNLSQLLEREGFTVKAAQRAYKPLTFDYSLVQFAEFNPMIYKTLNTLGKVVPGGLKSRVIPLPIGEMMLIAKKDKSWTAKRLPR